MTKETLAALLTGREYGSEISRDEEVEAHASGLVILFGYSDDNAEFRGAFTDEVGCYSGGTLYVNKEEALQPHDSGLCDCPYCVYDAKQAKSAKIEAVFDKHGYMWTYETSIPHATFEIVEGAEKYCRGIVFNISDLPQ